MAIGIKLKKADGKSDPGASKFFGDPTVPNAWVDYWSDDVIFFCQIKLSDIAALDTENRLPHTGYFYIFLDVEMYPYTPITYYFDGEPDTIIDEFNLEEPRFSHLTQAWDMEFYEVKDDADGIKLFGTPADWNYAEPSPELILQFDPLAAKTGFMEEVDGFVYLFSCGEEKSLKTLTLHVENS